MFGAHFYLVHILHYLYCTFIFWLGGSLSALTGWSMMGGRRWLHFLWREEVFSQPASVRRVWLWNFLKQNANCVRCGVVLLNLRAAAILMKSLKDSYQAFQQTPSRTPDNLCMQRIVGTLSVLRDFWWDFRLRTECSGTSAHLSNLHSGKWNALTSTEL